MKQDLHLIVADAKYGNHHFLGPLTEEFCGTLVRLYRDRVLYGQPGPYSGRGRPRVHADLLIAIAVGLIPGIVPARLDIVAAPGCE